MTQAIVASAPKAYLEGNCTAGLLSLIDEATILMLGGEEKCLGEGGEGVVHVYTWTLADGRSLQVAVKKMNLPPSECGQAREREKFKNMVALWRLACAKSLNMCKLHGVCWKETSTLAVMELQEGGSLQDYVANEHPRGLPRGEVLRLMLELVCALDALHTRAKTMHLDVKPANVLLTPAAPSAAAAYRSVRLADFGLSKLIRTRITSTRVDRGTLGYAAPEQQQRRGSAKSEVYSLGATLAFCATGRTPQLMSRSDASIDAVLARLPRLDGEDDVQLRALVLHLTVQEPAARPTMAEARDLIRDLCAAAPLTYCPITADPFSSTGAAAPRVLPCCGSSISFYGLQLRLSIGPHTCPHLHCNKVLPDQAADTFHTNDALACMLTRPLPQVRSVADGLIYINPSTCA